MDYQRLNELTNIACESIEHVLDALHVSYRKTRKIIYGTCPVHNGDNYCAFNLYPNGEEVRGIWVCRTHHCEQKYGKTFIGLVRGVLSKKYSREVSYQEASQWLLKLLGYTGLDKIPLPDNNILQKRNSTNAIFRQNIIPKQAKTGWKRENIRKMLVIPPAYYIHRGYKDTTLNKYDVGYLDKQKRIIVPVYDDNYKYAVGFLKRSIFQQCDKCKNYHDPNLKCPSSPFEIMNSCKWKNSDNFNSGSYLYNYWFSKDYIRESGVLILVEGAGDVWRLEENEIYGSVALCGCELTEEQLVIIENSGAMSIVCMLDNDEAGIAASINIQKKLQRTHRIYFPKFSEKDIGILSKDAITNDIKPIIEKIKSYKL